jgi:hypothetical protein
MSDETQELRQEIKTLCQKNQELRQRQEVTDRNVDRLLALVDGDKSLGIVGLRERQDQMDDKLSDWERSKTLLKGVGIGLGITGVGGTGTAVAILTKVFGGG